MGLIILSVHHDLDVYPIPREKQPMFINEPWLVDTSLFVWEERIKEPDSEADNVRIFAPVDLNKTAILRRLSHIISIYGEATENNEMNYSVAVNQLISQIEIYDQIWYARYPHSIGVGNTQHSTQAIDLVKQFVEALEAVSVADAECFPYEIIDELKKDYLS